MWRGSLAGPGVDDGGLGGAQRLGVGAAPVLVEDVAVGGGQDFQVGVVEQLPVGHQVGDPAQFGRRRLRGDQRGGDQGVLAREHLAGPGDADEGPALLVHLHVLQGVEIHEEAVAGVDEAVVELQRLRPVDAALLDGLAQRGHGVEGGEHGLEAGLRDGLEVAADVASPGRRPGSWLIAVSVAARRLRSAVRASAGRSSAR